MQLAKVQTEAQVNGGTVVAGYNEIVFATLVDGSALGRVGCSGYYIVSSLAGCAGRRDGRVGFRKSSSRSTFFSLVSFMNVSMLSSLI